MVQVLVDTSSNVLAFGFFGVAQDAGRVVTVDDSQLAQLELAGPKTLKADGTIAVDTAAAAAAQLAAQQAAQAAALQRATDVATLLNDAAVRDTQAHRDAFARIVGTKPLKIPLGQDATAADIAPL